MYIHRYILKEREKKKEEEEAANIHTDNDMLMLMFTIQ